MRLLLSSRSHPTVRSSGATEPLDLPNSSSTHSRVETKTSHHQTNTQPVAGWLKGPPETSQTYKVKLEEASGAGNGLATQLEGPSQQAQGLMPRRRGGSAGPTGTAESVKAISSCVQVNLGITDVDCDRVISRRCRFNMQAGQLICGNRPPRQ